jgi:phage virion morphogenesis protein
MRIEIKDDEITIGLAALQGRLSNMKPVMEEIGEYAVESTKLRFKAGKAPDGSTWQAKSPGTLASYGARKSNRVDVRPLFGPSGILSSQIFAEADADSVEWGSNRIYAAMMQFGGTKSAFPHLWGDIPARPFIGVSEDDRTNILDIMEEWLSRGWAQKG